MDAILNSFQAAIDAFQTAFDYIKGGMFVELAKYIEGLIKDVFVYSKPELL